MYPINYGPLYRIFSENRLRIIVYNHVSSIFIYFKMRQSVWSFIHPEVEMTSETRKTILLENILRMLLFDNYSRMLLPPSEEACHSNRRKDEVGKVNPRRNFHRRSIFELGPKGNRYKLSQLKLFHFRNCILYQLKRKIWNVERSKLT